MARGGHVGAAAGSGGARYRWCAGALASLLVSSLAPAVGADPLQVWTVDGVGRSRPLAATWASLERRAPAEVPVDPRRPDGDPDALRYLLAGAAAAIPSVIAITSRARDGHVIAELADLPLQVYPCPGALAARRACAVTPPVRAVADEVDARHPLVRHRSLRAELGGALVLSRAAGGELGRITVGGPRSSPLGPLGRYRAKLHVVLVRVAPGGGPPVGADAATARAVAAGAIRRAARLWGACGIGFGDGLARHIAIVDPPPPFVLSLGCGHGLPASGGDLRFTVEGRPQRVALAAGMSPAAAARRVTAMLRRAGARVRVVLNARGANAALGSADVLVQRPDGSLASLTAPRTRPISSDRTMTACIGHVDLGDGLQHFRNVDSAVGSLEERTLLHAVVDDDPATIDVVIVPGFALGGRIGESFIASDRGAQAGVVIVDRAAIGAGAASFSLAHELGHVLLDDPGHADDHGRDTPTRLMDGDASDPSAFGPRRLLVSECAQALRQSGPQAPLPWLEPWPLPAQAPPR